MNYDMDIERKKKKKKHKTKKGYMEYTIPLTYDTNLILFIIPALHTVPAASPAYVPLLLSCTPYLSCIIGSMPLHPTHGKDCTFEWA